MGDEVVVALLHSVGPHAPSELSMSWTTCVRLHFEGVRLTELFTPPVHQGGVQCVPQPLSSLVKSSSAEVGRRAVGFAWLLKVLPALGALARDARAAAYG